MASSSNGANPNTEIRKLGRFVSQTNHKTMSHEAREALKKRILDTVGVAIGARDGEPIQMIREQTEDFCGATLCTFNGCVKSYPARVGIYNGGFSRYCDFKYSLLDKRNTRTHARHLCAVRACR